jgi:hypothetical protein
MDIFHLYTYDIELIRNFSIVINKIYLSDSFDCLNNLLNDLILIAYYNESDPNE